MVVLGAGACEIKGVLSGLGSDVPGCASMTCFAAGLWNLSEMGQYNVKCRVGKPCGRNIVQWLGYYGMHCLY